MKISVRSEDLTGHNFPILRWSGRPTKSMNLSLTLSLGRRGKETHAMRLYIFRASPPSADCPYKKSEGQGKTIKFLEKSRFEQGFSSRWKVKFD